MDKFIYKQSDEVLEEQVQFIKKIILEGKAQNKHVVNTFLEISVSENREENKRLAYKILDDLASKYDIDYCTELDYEHPFMKNSKNKINGEYLSVAFYLDV